MLKLMIVDDEYLFREALKISIQWQELGYELCCEAENGVDALEKIMEYKPEVALVDINMPIMDGLELAAEIKEKSLNVRTIIITGYGEFHYARQAVEIGVENYLLKPIEETELAKTLVDVRISIEKEKKAILEIEMIRKQVKEFKPMLKQMMLNDILSGKKKIKQNEIKELKKNFNIDFEAANFQVAVIELDEKEEFVWDGDDRQLWCFAVSNIAAEIFGEYYFYEMSWDTSSRVNILIKEPRLKDGVKRDIVNLCERIRTAAPKYLNFSVTIGIGGMFDSVGRISNSYEEALIALKDKFVSGSNRVIFFENTIEADLPINPYNVNQRQQILIYMRIGDVDGVETIITEVFNKLATSNLSSEFVFVVYIDLISTCMEYAAETGSKVKKVLEYNGNIIEEIEKKRSLKELESWIKNMFIKMVNHVHYQRLKRKSKIVEEAEKYIHEHYFRFELKIDDIARHVYVKYGHLCFLFKRDTGKTINDYLTDLRITKAKELFDKGVRSVAEVSNKVGYADANYFGKSFKKTFGITPGRYLETISLK